MAGGRGHARRADEARLLALQAAPAVGVEHGDACRPRRRHPGRQPGCELLDERRVARGEVLRAVVAGPAFATAGTGATTRPTTFVEDSYTNSGVGEAARAGQAGDPGADDCIV
jgi:hypothetical protein